MRFGILGTLSIDDDHGSVALTGAKPRQVLALLLVHANRDVPAATLIDGLWTEPPKSALNALQVHVGKVRRVLEPATELTAAERLTTTPTGYRLHVPPDELDAFVFEQRLADARAAAAAGRLGAADAAYRRALALWRGRALEEFDGELWAHAEQARLGALRTTAVEEHVDVLLADGRETEVVAELEAELARDPSRERQAAQLMIALYRSARQLDALDVAQRVRRHLAEEHGVEPGDALRRVEHLVLTQSSELTRRPVMETGVALPLAARRGADALFVGRIPELAMLDDVWREVEAGTTRFVALTGEPGIGKTRLACRFAQRAYDGGAALVLWGRCPAHESAAFRPFVEALTPLVASMDAMTMSNRLGDAALALATLIPAARDRAVEASTGAGRAQQFDAVAALLADASAEHPVLLVIDDVQWADISSRALLDHLGRRADLGRVLVLLVARDAQGSALAPMERADRLIALEGLAEDDIAQLVAIDAATAPAGGELARALRERTAGNPLFVEQLLRNRDDEGELHSIGAYPDPMRAIIDRRVRSLAPDVVQVLEVAAVAGRDFDEHLIADACGVDVGVARDALAVATKARLIDAVDDPRVTHAFVHELVRQVIYDALGSEVRAERHDAVAAALESVDGRDATVLAELARHCTASHDRVRLQAAIRYEQRSAEVAAEMLAFEDAARHYEQAVTLLARVDPRNRGLHCDLLLGLSRMRFLAGEPAASKIAYLSTVEVARELGEWERLAAVAIGGSGWTQQFWAPYGTVATEAVALLEESLALAPPGDSALRAGALARLAEELHFADDTDARDAYARAALECARRVDDPATTADALQSVLRSTWAPDNVDERIALSREMLEAATRANRGALAATAHGRLATGLFEIGDFAQADAHIEQMGGLLPRYGEPTHKNWWWGMRGARALMVGDFDECERLMAEAAIVAPEIFGWEQAYAGVMCVLAVERDRTTELLPIGEDFVAQYPQIHAWRAGLACLLANAGRPDAARTRFDETVAAGLDLIRRDQNFLFCFAALAETASIVGALPTARAVYDALLPYRDHWVVLGDGFVVWSHVERLLGVFARSMGDLERSEEHLRRALGLHRAASATALVTRTEFELGRTLLLQGHDADAARLFDEARVVAERLGQAGLLRGLAQTRQPADDKS